MKRVKKLFPVVWILLSAFVLLVTWNQNKYPAIIKAISNREAVGFSETQEGYYIVRIQGASGLFYQLLEADGSWGNLWLAGDFAYQLSGSLACPGNKFLVKGQLKERAEGEEPAAQIIDCKYELKMESRKMIFPIRRDYSDVGHFRFFYPGNRIDEYDRDHGDYIEK